MEVILSTNNVFVKKHEAFIESRAEDRLSPMRTGLVFVSLCWCISYYDATHTHTELGLISGVIEGHWAPGCCHVKDRLLEDIVAVVVFFFFLNLFS